MVQRTVICDRCGNIIENPHPDNTSIVLKNTRTILGNLTRKVFTRQRSQCTYVANAKLNSMNFGRTNNDKRDTV